MSVNNQQLLFDEFKIEDWEKHWVGMPEYNNTQQPEPLIIAMFKFKNEKDYLKFKNLVQEYVFDGEKVFDGMQRLDRKSTWYPHKEKASNYKYTDESTISNIHNK